MIVQWLLKEILLDVLSRTPSNTVSLILTDPPYHSTKKSNITGDKSFQEDISFYTMDVRFRQGMA